MCCSEFTKSIQVDQEHAFIIIQICFFYHVITDVIIYQVKSRDMTIGYKSQTVTHTLPPYAQQSSQLVLVYLLCRVVECTAHLIIVEKSVFLLTVLPFLLKFVLHFFFVASRHSFFANPSP